MKFFKRFFKFSPFYVLIFFDFLLFLFEKIQKKSTSFSKFHFFKLFKISGIFNFVESENIEISKISNTLFGISFIYCCTLFSPIMKRFRPLSVWVCPYHYQTHCPTHFRSKWLTYWVLSLNCLYRRDNICIGPMEPRIGEKLLLGYLSNLRSRLARLKQLSETSKFFLLSKNTHF